MSLDIQEKSKRKKFARWVWIAVSVFGVSISMAMPARADIDESHCENEGGSGSQSEEIVIVQEFDTNNDGVTDRSERKCFEGDGEKFVSIADVASLYSRDNNGSVNTNKGTFQFWDNEQINFNAATGGTIVITGISLE
ncbi:MAG: hypothetical protein ACRC1Z_24020 [Waterburya sp.]